MNYILNNNVSARKNIFVTVKESNVTAIELMLIDGIIERDHKGALPRQKSIIDDTGINIRLNLLLEIIGALVIVDIKMLDAGK